MICDGFCGGVNLNVNGVALLKMNGKTNLVPFPFCTLSLRPQGRLLLHMMVEQILPVVLVDVLVEYLNVLVGKIAVRVRVEFDVG